MGFDCCSVALILFNQLIEIKKLVFYNYLVDVVHFLLNFEVLLFLLLVQSLYVDHGVLDKCLGMLDQIEISIQKVQVLSDKQLIYPFNLFVYTDKVLILYLVIL